MSGAATYGFVLFDDLMNAVAAKHYMDGQNIRGNKIRVRGRGTNVTCPATSAMPVWIVCVDILYNVP